MASVALSLALVPPSKVFYRLFPMEVPFVMKMALPFKDGIPGLL